MPQNDLTSAQILIRMLHDECARSHALQAEVTALRAQVVWLQRIIGAAWLAPPDGEPDAQPWSGMAGIVADAAGLSNGEDTDDDATIHP